MCVCVCVCVVCVCVVKTANFCRLNFLFYIPALFSKISSWLLYSDNQFAT